MPIETILFYAVFVAPGFVAVMAVISLAAIEEDYSAFTLLVWSLVASLVIDTLFIGYYQWADTPIESFDQFTGILFDPHFQVRYVLGILAISAVVGVVAAVGILADIPGRMRRVLQAKSQIRVNPRQPWANFMRDTWSVRIKTSDGELYEGLVTEWSRAGQPKEVRIKDPHYYDFETGDYQSMKREEMLFLEKDIDRLLMREKDERQSVRNRFNSWRRNRRSFRARGGAWLGQRRSVRAVVCRLCERWSDQEERDNGTAE